MIYDIIRQIRDHPLIERAMATGEENPQETQEPRLLRCSDCGKELEYWDDVYIWFEDRLCEDCCKESLLGSFSVKEIAKAMNIETKTAGDVLYGF